MEIHNPVHVRLPPSGPTPNPGVSRAVDRFLHSVVGYKCIGRDANVSEYRVYQALVDNVYRAGLIKDHRICTGSMYEGMPDDVCSDCDEMVNERDFPVVLTPPTSAHKRKTQHRQGYVIPEGNPDQPAYLKLAVPDGLTFRSDRIAHTMTEYKGSTYLSSKLMANYELPEYFRINGPAQTTQITSDYGYDSVYCLRSPAWPVCAEEFFTRPRSHGWPPQSLLNLIKKAGCHVVGACYPYSQRGDLEWRWSCSGAEKQIIHKLDTEMACTMYVMKSVKRRLWPAGKAVDMCSYYLKIACLWVAEIAPHQGSCMAYTRLVLDWLIQCYGTYELPHYFIRSQNLISHLSHYTCKQVASKLKMVKSELWVQVLCSVEIDSDLEDAVRSMAIQLDIPPADLLTKEEYRRILNSLFGCDKEKVVQVLEKAAQAVGPSSKAYVKKERYPKDIDLPGPFFELYSLMKELVVMRSPTVLMRIPSRILLPLIENLPSIISPSHVDMFRILLYTSLGDLHLYMHAHYKGSHESPSSRLAAKCFQRAKQYYTECTHGSPFEGTALCAYVHLAKLCYLTEALDELEDVLVHLKPMLEEVELTRETLDRFNSIFIDTFLDVHTVPWKGDKVTYRRLVSTLANKGCDILINPVVLGYYFLGRHSLGQCRRDLAEVSIRRMEKALEVMDADEIKSPTTEGLNSLLQFYIKQYDRSNRSAPAKRHSRKRNHPQGPSAAPMICKSVQCNRAMDLTEHVGCSVSIKDLFATSKRGKHIKPYHVH